MPRPRNTEDALPPVLSDLRDRLEDIEAECNPQQEDLHFGVPVRTSPSVLEDIYDIGLEAWHAVEHHRSKDASDWFYDWFLLVANVCLQIRANHTQAEYSDDLVTRLALLLVDISQMTLNREYEGDIQKRLFEALAHVLLAFGQRPGPVELLTRRAQEVKNEYVLEFVRETIAWVQEYERKESQPSN